METFGEMVRRTTKRTVQWIKVSQGIDRLSSNDVAKTEPETNEPAEATRK
jgi:hypothetical protein